MVVLDLVRRRRRRAATSPTRPPSTPRSPRVVAEHGRLDVLVNSAGIAHVGTLATTTEADLDRVYAVNVKGVSTACGPGVRHMVDAAAAPSSTWRRSRRWSASPTASPTA